MEDILAWTRTRQTPAGGTAALAKEAAQSRTYTSVTRSEEHAMRNGTSTTKTSGRPRAELDLLEIFGAVMEEKSMARAAARLAMTPSAVSHNVARLRQLFNDPLFVRDAFGVKPTEQASGLWERISEPLTSLRLALDVSEFDPATTRFQMRFALNDMLSQLVLPKLFHQLSAQAPGLLLSVKPRYPGQDEAEIVRGTLDFAVGVVGSQPPGELQIRRLWQDRYVCMHRKGHPIGPVTLAALAKWPRIAISPDAGALTTVELALASMGLKRPPQLVASTFSCVPQLVAGSDCVAIVPSKYVYKVVATDDTLAQTPLAMKLPPLDYSLVWHPRSDRRPGHQWLRTQVETQLRAWAQRNNGG